MFQAIGQFIVSVALGAAALFGYHQAVFGGAAVYVPVPRYESSLALALTATQTSTMNLVSGVDGNGMPLSGPTCFTIDSGVANSVEDVCGTASGTVVSNLTRGVDSSGYNGSSTLSHAHRVGADVKITDSPYLAQIASLLNGSSSLPNPLTYSTSVSTSTIAATSTNLVSVALLNATAFAGAPNGSPTVKGIFEEATQQEVASGTQTGTTGAHLVIPATAASRTASSSPVVVVASGTSSGIDSSFLLNGNYSLGSTTVQSLTSASTTLNGTTTLPNATNTILTTNAYGSIYSIGSATTGTMLQYYNGKWNTGIQEVIATTSATMATTTVNTLLETIALPNASKGSVYEFVIQFQAQTNGNGYGGGTTSTVVLTGNGVSSTFSIKGGTENNTSAALIYGRIMMQQSTSSEYVSGATNGTSQSGLNALSSLDLSASPSLQVYVLKASGSASQNFNTTTTFYMIQ